MVFRAANIDEAIAIANDTPFGLGSSVWTKEKEEQDRFVRDIQAGMTAINQMLASSPEAPFGGIKRSGHGRELGLYGLHRSEARRVGKECVSPFISRCSPYL